MTITSAPTRRQSRKQFLSAAGGALLALSAAAGLGAWRFIEQGPAPRPAVAMSRFAVIQPARATAPVSPLTPLTVTIYVVASEEEALDLHSMFAALAPADQWYRVLIIEPSQDDGQVLRWLAHINEERESNSLPPNPVVDLRGRWAPQPR